jgi:hypothetical protein
MVCVIQKEKEEDSLCTPLMEETGVTALHKVISHMCRRQYVRYLQTVSAKKTEVLFFIFIFYI